MADLAFMQHEGSKSDQEKEDAARMASPSESESDGLNNFDRVNSISQNDVVLESTPLNGQLDLEPIAGQGATGLESLQFEYPSNYENERRRTSSKEFMFYP